MTIRKVNDFLTGVPMTVVGGVFLVISLVLMLTDTKTPIDPAWVSVLVCGLPLLYLTVYRVIHNKGMNRISSAMLISIAMVAAIALGDLFAAGEVAFIMAIGAILEEKTADRAKKGLKKLISLAPAQGRLIEDGEERMVNAEDIRKGDVLRVLPGEAIPVDGVIISGATSIDQSIVTGESLPVDKVAGDETFCGTVNRFGSIDIRATKVGEDSSLQKLIRLVQDAEHRKAPLQRIADTWAAWLVPIALLIALLAGLGTGDIVRAVTVLVVFCPCALVLATPTAIMAAIGQATKYGVIIKSGEALERMGRVDTIALDKTGTITSGSLTVKEVLSFDQNWGTADVLRLTASAESCSEHPLAKAIVSYMKEKGSGFNEVDCFETIPGRGIKAEIEGTCYLFGNADFMKESGVPVEGEAALRLDRLRNQGKAVILAADSKKLIGAIALSDTLKPATRRMVQELSEVGTDVMLLTGDHADAARHFADQAGIATMRAGLLPAKKVEEIRNLQEEGRNVGMIGDGINDAPALKTADVGIAMGAIGSDIAIEAADIALVNDDVGKIPYLKRLSDATVRTIRASISLSLLINFIAISLSVMGLLTPTTGALVHNAGSILVVFIAALLYDRKFIDE